MAKILALSLSRSWKDMAVTIMSLPNHGLLHQIHPNGSIGDVIISPFELEQPSTMIEQWVASIDTFRYEYHFCLSKKTFSHIC